MDTQVPEMQFDNYLIRPLGMNDTADFFSLVDSNRRRLEDFFSGTVAKNKNIEATSIFIPEMIEKMEQKIHYPFVVTEISTQKLIGYIDIKSIDWNIPKAELGYFIDEHYEGKGIITKALSKIIAYCFDTLQINKLLVRTHEANIGSRKMVEKNGFRVEGIIRNDYITTSGNIVDLMYYGLLRTER